MVGVPRFSEDLACKISQTQRRRRVCVYNEEVMCFQLCSSTLQTSYNTFPGTFVFLFLSKILGKNGFFFGINCVIVGIGIKGENGAITNCQCRGQLWFAGMNCVFFFAIFPIWGLLVYFRKLKCGFFEILETRLFN